MQDINDVPFWIGQSWPYAPSEYIFLCEAVLATGKHLFGDEWRGDEPCPSEMIRLGGGSFYDMFTLAPTASAKRDHRKAVEVLKNAGYEPAYRETKYGGIHILTRACWDRAMQIAKAHDTECAKRHGRFVSAVQLITEGLRSGSIQFALRPVSGGAMTDQQPAHLWHTEKLAPRFKRGQMSPSDPYGPAFAGKGFHYIFLERSSFDAFLNRSAGDQRSSKPKAKFSRPAAEREMQAIIDEWRAGKIQQPRRDDVVARLQGATGATTRAGRDIYKSMRPHEWGKSGPRQDNAD